MHYSIIQAANRLAIDNHVLKYISNPGVIISNAPIKSGLNFIQGYIIKQFYLVPNKNGTFNVMRYYLGPELFFIL